MVNLRAGLTLPGRGRRSSGNADPLLRLDKDVEDRSADSATRGVFRMVACAFQRGLLPWRLIAGLWLCGLLTGCHASSWKTAGLHSASVSHANSRHMTSVAGTSVDGLHLAQTSGPPGLVNPPNSDPVRQVAISRPGDREVLQRAAVVESDAAVQVVAKTEVAEKRSVESGVARDVMAPRDAQPIDLSTALMLTSGRSPEVAWAQARIEESRAQLDRAEMLWLPSLRAGANYNKHEGRIQDVAGSIIETSRGSGFSGLGAGAVGAGSPSVPGVVAQFHLGDAVFQPGIAQQTMRARGAYARAASHNELLKTALAHLQMLKATQELAVVTQTVVQFEELVRVTREFAAAGQGLESDHDRARTELALRRNELLQTEEAVRVSSARLAQQVRWEYGVELRPAESQLYPVSLVPVDTAAQGLVAVGLSNRPEIAESRHLISEAVERLRREQFAPLLPSVLLGVSYGGQIGGLGGRFENSGDRLDADAMAYWEIRQLGFGEQLARREARARILQTRTRQLTLMDSIAREIVESHAQVQSRGLQIKMAEESVSAAQDSFRRNWERIQNGQGLPIEALQSIQALATAQKEYIRTIADHNAAQFTLQRSLGWPVNAVASATGPAGSATH